MKSLASCLTRTFRKWNVPILAVFAALGLVMYCTSAVAQSGAGSIQGTVEDSTRAVLPGATIRVVNQATGVAATATSNEVGFYQVPGLFTGMYEVTVTAPNMKSYRVTVQLQVAQAAVVNPIMSAGAVTQQVEVAANIVQLTTTDNGTISSTLESNRINQLPMNGRMLLTLTGMTTPGLESTGQRANGLMPEALEYVQDGAPLINRNFGGVGNSTQSQLPDPDSVQEVRMETTNTSAMYSAPATGLITTKSGTNSLHGSFFETARNNAVGIAKGRQNPYNYAAPHLVRNEFGASAGGPIIIPGAYRGKDKSFWFFAYERYSLAATTNDLTTVPTNAMRGGDWSGYTDSQGIFQQLYDPLTTAASTNCNGSGSTNQWCRTPFGNNQIPIGRLSPTTKILYAITPTQTSNDNPMVTSNFISPNAQWVPIPTMTFRLDHSFNETNKSYLRYTHNIQTNRALRNYPNPTPATIAYGDFPFCADDCQNINIATFSSAAGFTHVFSPTFFSETIYSMMWFNQYVGGGGNVNLNYEKMLGLPNNFGQTGFPNIGSSSGVGSKAVTTLIKPYGGTMYQYQEAQIIFNLDENFTKTVGKHQMQFGGRWRHERFMYLPDRSSDSVGFGLYATALEDPTSGTNYSATPHTGGTDADFFLGASSQYSINLQPPRVHYHDMEFDGYFQDNYHISRNLTVNLGIRYENHPGAWTKYGLSQGFDLKNKAQVLTYPISYYIARGYTTQAIVTNLQNLGVVFESPKQAGYPDKMIRDYPWTFSPRVGLAYQPFGGRHGTVIRGAYGRYIYPVPVRNSIRNTTTGVPFVANYYRSYVSAAQSPDSLPNYLLRSPQTVIMGQNSTGVVDSTSTNAILPGFGLWNLAPNQAPDYVTQMNFTIEQPMRGNSALRLTWLWSHGTNLDHYYYYNQHPSNYVWEMMTGTVPPTGGASAIGTPQYANTGTGPYDKIIYGGGMNWDAKDGWSNDNALQVNYQRLYHRGIAYQISYVWSKPFRLGGNYFRDAAVYNKDSYFGNSGGLGTMTSPFGTVITPTLPPPQPKGIAPYANWHAMNKYAGYNIDTAIPKQHITFNGVVDMPFGRGKRFLGNANSVLNQVVGGFQLAGNGNIVSSSFYPAVGNWGPINPIKTYKQSKAKITDCRSGVCHPAYMWFNGYIPPGLINASTKGISGLPTGYAAYSSPIDTTVGTANYNTNRVNVTLSNGNTGVVDYSPGPVGAHPYSHTNLNGPINWTADLSVFKVFPITERMNLRVNVDAFNAFNVQGFNNPNGTDGIQQIAPGVGVASSANTPRQLQFTMRFTF